MDIHSQLLRSGDGRISSSGSHHRRSRVEATDRVSEWTDDTTTNSQCERHTTEIARRRVFHVKAKQDPTGLLQTRHKTNPLTGTTESFIRKSRDFVKEANLKATGA